jgi:hypothetical protein
MKEIEYNTLESIVKKEIDALNIRYIFVFIGINLLIALVNWLIQRNVKTIENRIYKKKVREDRRIEIIEEVYKELVSFTYIFSSKEMIKANLRIAKLEKKVSENRLYIDSRMNNKITTYIDYLKKLLTDFRHKDFKREEMMLNDIVKEFDR